MARTKKIETQKPALAKSFVTPKPIVKVPKITAEKAIQRHEKKQAKKKQVGNVFDDWQPNAEFEMGEEVHRYNQHNIAQRLVILNFRTNRGRENGDYLDIQALIEEFTEKATKDYKPYLELISKLDHYLQTERVIQPRKKVKCQFYEPDRIEINNFRWYKVPESEVMLPSVTQVGKHFMSPNLKRILENWEQRDPVRAAKVRSDGDTIHHMIEVFLNTGEIIGHGEDIRIDALWANIHPHAKKFSETEDVLLVEGMVWKRTDGEDVGYAGAIDYVGQDRESHEVVLRDWKTSKNLKLPGRNDDQLFNMRMQVAAYSMAFTAVYGVRVDRAEIWIVRDMEEEKPVVVTLDQVSIAVYYEVFLRRLNAFYREVAIQKALKEQREARKSQKEEIKEDIGHTILGFN